MAPNSKDINPYSCPISQPGRIRLQQLLPLTLNAVHQNWVRLDCNQHDGHIEVVAHSRSISQKTNRAWLGVRADVRSTIRYPFARVSPSSDFVTNLDCSPVRHFQIGIIDQAVHLSCKGENALWHCRHLPAHVSFVYTDSRPTTSIRRARSSDEDATQPPVLFRPELDSARLQLLSPRSSPPFACYHKGATYSLTTTVYGLYLSRSLLRATPYSGSLPLNSLRP